MRHCIQMVRRASGQLGSRMAIMQSRMFGLMRSKLACEKGQGTTEYAILVGVLVVIAILAITIFKPKIEELWSAITTGIQGL